MRPTALLVPLVLLPACAALEEAGRALLPDDRPTVEVAEVRLTGLSLQAVTLQLDLDVTNPWGAALPLAALDWTLASSGTELLRGQAAPGTSVPAHGTARVPLALVVPFDGLLAVLPSVRPGSVVPWEAQLGLAVDAPALGRLRLPLSARGELPVPAVPQVSLRDLSFTELSLARAAGTLRVGVRNGNAFACTPQASSLTLDLGGRRVAEAGLPAAGALAPGAEALLEVPISFSPLSAGTALLELLRGASAGYVLQGRLGVGTPYGTFEAPFRAEGTTPLGH
jgi:hypothetical protein